MLECHFEKNKARCACTYESCKRRGRCCECIAHHWELKQLPGCLFSAEGERTYDRSIQRFISESQPKG